MRVFYLLLFLGFLSCSSENCFINQKSPIMVELWEYQGIKSVKVDSMECWGFRHTRNGIIGWDRSGINIGSFIPSAQQYIRTRFR